MGSWWRLALTDVDSGQSMVASFRASISPMNELRISELDIGEGPEAAQGQKVSVHYTGWLADGKKFDSSHDRGSPFQFTLGEGKVIKGWDLGVEGMRVGGKRKLTVPPELGYGKNGADARIPPDATLVFEVELLDIQQLPFPFDVFAYRDFPGAIGERMETFGPSCCFPPFPWGQWVYGRLIQEHCSSLAGDLIELGVGAGGTSLFFASMVADAKRKVYSLDTFSGLPAPDHVLDNPYWRAGLYTGVVPLGPRLKGLAEEHGLSDVLVMVEGLFSETIPTLPADTRFCLAHLDSDLYSSVMDSLTGIYDRVVDGGIILFDDFFHHAQGPARACSDFFNERGITPVYHIVFPYSVGIIKNEQAPSLAGRSLDGNTYSFDWLRSDALLRSIVARSVDRAIPGTREHRNAELLLSILDSETARTSDVYAYWSALEQFWDSMALGFS
jgi:hypothetical protein